MPPTAVAALVLAFVLCAWAHVGAYRFCAEHWAGRTASRVAFGVFFGGMFVLPLLLRALPQTEITALVARIGTLWHLFVMLAAVPFVAYSAWRWVQARRARALPETARLSPEELPAEPARRRALETGLALGGATVSASIFGWSSLVTRVDWEVVEIPIKIARLPRELDGFTIIQVSDIHVGHFMGETTLRRGLALVQAQRGDLIVVTGDIIDHERRYIPLGARLFGALRARAGVYCIPGNHDHYTGAVEVMAAFEKAGVIPLVNRHVTVPGADGGLILAGVDDRWARRNPHLFAGGPDLVKALSGSPEDAARVLLAHQPLYVDEYPERIDLQLSGHTHGGQINPVGPLLPAMIPYLKGHYQVGVEGDKQLYVNRGFGTAGPPARILSRPEITRIVLVSG